MVALKSGAYNSNIDENQLAHAHTEKFNKKKKSITMHTLRVIGKRTII